MISGANIPNDPPSSLSTVENLYERMIEEIQDYAIILLDRDGYIRKWNRGAQKIKQYTESEIVGKHFSIFYFPEDQAAGLPNRLIQLAASTGRAVHEGWRKRKDGSRFWGSITITAIHDANGNIVGFSKVTRDLTEKKIAEDALRMSEERYHQMVAEVQDYAIILLSPEGVIQNWNAGAENIKGYKASEVVGKKFEIFYTPEDKARGLPGQLLDRARTTGKALQEGWRVRKDGSRFWGTIVITALHGADKRIIGFSKVTRDLTEKKMADERLIAYTKELEIQNNELEQFAYVASHDLQEPLRKIQTFSSLIKANYTNKEFADRYFGKLEASAKRMAELVRSLLNYSRLGKSRDDETEVNLNELLEEVKVDYELLIQEKEARVKHDDLPAIRGNRMQLGQLFSNLVGNSLKFSGMGVEIAISHAFVKGNEIVDVRPEDAGRRFLKITFSDNGIGFDQQYGKLIFSLFQRLNSRESYAGTGIGLALCKKIAENHGGYIEALGELNKGATFNVFLPA